jgi:phosphate transport system substrate-binding protein
MEAILIKHLLMAASAALVLAGCGQAGSSDGAGGPGAQIRIVGSSTVFPFSKAVAERFAQTHTSFSAPIVESVGTGAGFQLFCAGVGSTFPDVSNASRRIKASELELCNSNGVTRVIEVPIGSDGLALIESVDRPTGYDLTPRDIYMAVAANPFGRPNRARTWRDVNPALPDVAIQVYGPPPTSGTRDSFVELILEKGCDTDPATKALKESDSERHKTLCHQLREDGAFVEAGENDNLLMQRVAANQGAIGVLGYSFLAENRDRVRGIPIAGVAPTEQSIQDQSYPGARQIYIYVKGEHVGVVPGLQEFLDEYARAWGAGGYLAQRGLIPASAEIQQAARSNIRQLTAMELAQLK